MVKYVLQSQIYAFAFSFGLAPIWWGNGVPLATIVGAVCGVIGALMGIREWDRLDSIWLAVQPIGGGR